MIKLDINGKDFELTENITKYVEKKIGRLDKFLPSTSQATGGEVILRQDASNKTGNKFYCEATIHVPGGELQAKDATVNMFAAVDIVEAKLKTQALKYKARIKPQSYRQRLMGKIIGREQLAVQPSEEV